jgi:transcriptional regulator with XRE-family HTH domain
MNEFSKYLKASIGLRLTQRSLGKELGVRPSHIALIETGKRGPSLTLIRRMADTVGFDPRTLFLLSYPEARHFLPNAGLHKATSQSWYLFVNHHELLVHYCITGCELNVLQEFAETPLSLNHFLAVSILINELPRHHRKADYRPIAFKMEAGELLISSVDSKGEHLMRAPPAAKDGRPASR